MRFSISQLLLVFPAWVIAFSIGPFLQPLVCVTWKHDRAANDVRQIRMWAISEIAFDDSAPDFSDFDQQQLITDFDGLTDPWGNQYQIIELDRVGLLDYDVTFHAYSLGADGTSRSNGNDLDDINSWDYDRRRHYGTMLRNHEMKSNLWRALWLTPIIYLFLSFGVRRYASTTQNG